MDGIDEVRARFDHAEDVTPDPDADAESASWMESVNTGDGGAGQGGQFPPHPPEEGGDLPPLARAAAQPLNDYGNGQRFAIHFGEDVIFVPRVGWFSWQGMCWRKDEDELAVRAKAQKIWALIEKEIDFLTPSKREQALLNREKGLREQLRALEDAAPEARGEDYDAQVGVIMAQLRSIDAALKDRKSLIGRRLTHAKNAGNKGPIDNMLKESTTDLAVPFEVLDARPLEVNTLSGLLRFSVEAPDGAGKVARVDVIPHAREQYLSKIIEARYDPAAESPLFQSFLERVQPDIEMRRFLQRWIGLGMTGLKVQRLAFFYGSGANGKSVLVDLIGRLYAGYSTSLKIESLTGSNRRQGADATPDLIPLLGARFVRTSEPDQGEKLQEGLIKQLTGGEPIAVRPNYGDQIEMDPIFKLTISGNHKPEVRGTDDGIWRRLLLVPFNVQIPEAERDEHLGEKLWAERDGVLAWAVEGLIDFLEGGLRPPEEVLEATSEYREASDPLGAFLTTCCVITGDHRDKILTYDLERYFNYYLRERAENTWKPSTFTRQMAPKALHWRHPITGLQIEKSKASISQYLGLKLTDDFKARFEDAPKDASGYAIDVTRSTATPHPASGDFID